MREIISQWTENYWSLSSIPFSVCLSWFIALIRVPSLSLCALRPGNVVIHCNVPAYHNSPSPFLLFLSFLLSSTYTLFSICRLSISLPFSTVLSTYFLLSVLLSFLFLHSHPPQQQYCSYTDHTMMLTTLFLLLLCPLPPLSWWWCCSISTAQKCWGSPERPHIDWCSLMLQSCLFILCFSKSSSNSGCLTTTLDLFKHLEMWAKV